MNMIKNSRNTFINLDIMSIVMLFLSLSSLSIIALSGILTPVLLFMLMILCGMVLIVFFSHDEVFIKLKLFIFFFSFYLFYVILHDYILLISSPGLPPFDYTDERTFYHFSDLALPYISGEKRFFDLFTFAAYPLHEQPLYAMFIGAIAYLSTIVDGSNIVMAQKILSPFLGGMFSVILYSTLKYQFSDHTFSLKSTLAYGLLSAVFMYSTPLLRDIDVALAYMIFFYIFLQKFTVVRLGILFLVAFLTVYLRVESGMVLYGLVLIYIYFYVRTIDNRSIKFIYYILMTALFSFVVMLKYKKIIGMIIGVKEGYTSLSVAESSEGSISLLINKLPFGLSETIMLLYKQLIPFPFFNALGRPAEAISGLFWPFVFMMMIYAIIKTNIRIKIDEKVKYLLVMAIIVIILMSSGAALRRMMSLYPVIYITSLYAFFIIPINEIKRIFSYYIFGIISLNTFFYFIKL